ncbi:hypothetical protein Q7P37_003667 [Cladosporium fusiforme]
MQLSSSNGVGLSLITPIGASYYALAKILTPEHYQMLMDRGWRRLPASEFQASRDQRQAIYRWNRFVLGEKYIKQASLKNPKGKGEKKRNTNTFDLVTAVHESEESDILPDVEPAPDHRFTTTLEPDTFDEEKYALFQDYQQHVHNEGPSDITKAGFKRFLCSSPVDRRTEASGKKLGSYHHCYRLDGRLIAMAVLDLLPHAVSGVYFLYHRDFEKWSLGKLSALRETALALEGGYQYYYMGYYIHSCLKMRYKGTYKPQHRKWVSMSRERQGKDRTVSPPGPSETDNNPEASNPTSTPAVEPSTLYPTPNHPIPIDAASSNLSLLELGMPGVLSPTELEQKVDLDNMKIFLGKGGVHRTQDIVSWQDGSATDPASIKGVIAEFAACLGPELARGVVVNFGR